MHLIPFLGTDTPRPYVPKPKRPVTIKPTAPVRNPKQGAQMAAAHERWMAEQFPSRVEKRSADPASVSFTKQAARCHRFKAREIKGVERSDKPRRVSA